MEFDLVNHLAVDESRHFSLLTLLIYDQYTIITDNEELRDLLSFSANGAPATADMTSPLNTTTPAPTVAAEPKKQLRLMEDFTRGVVCQSLEEFEVLTMRDTLLLLKRGAHHRARASTLNNGKSSRSHAIFSLRVVVKQPQQQQLSGSINSVSELISMGQLNLVDLAG